MRLLCSRCQDALSIIDVLTLKIKYSKDNQGRMEQEAYNQHLLNQFDVLAEMFREADFKVWKSWSYGRKCYYIPELKAFLIEPCRYDGCGKIRICEPDADILQVIQDVLLKFMDAYVLKSKLNRNVVLRKYIKLHRIEFAYDFYFDGGTLDDYAGLVLRLAANIFPIRARNTFAIAIVGKPKKCRDGARNGNITVYIQSCCQKDCSTSSEKLHRNLNAATHTKVYPKEFYGIWFCRVEMTPNKIKLNQLIQFDPENFVDVLRQAKIPFSDFYEFRTSQADKLIKFVEPRCKTDFAKRVKLCAIQAHLKNSLSMPVVEQMRAMCNTGNRYHIHQQRKTRLIEKISMEDAVNRPLPDGFHISQRKGKHELPDDVLVELDRDVDLRCLHKMKKVEQMACQVKGQVVQYELPVSKTSQNICENMPELGFSEHENIFSEKSKGNKNRGLEAKSKQFTRLSGKARAGP